MSKPPWGEELLDTLGLWWPQGDEDQMWDLAQDWHTAADSLKDIDQDIDAAISAVQAAYPDGTGGDAMIKQLRSMRTGNQSIDQLTQWFKNVGDSASQAGDSIESAKIQFETLLITTAAELLINALDPVTEGPADAFTILAAREAAKLGTKELLQYLAKAILKDMVLAYLKNEWKKLLLLNVVLPTTVVLGDEGYQVLTGHRKSINWEEVGLTAAGGLASGLAGGLMGSFLHGLMGDFADKLGGKFVTGLLSGGAGALGGWATNAALTDNWQWSWKGLTQGAVFGAAGGLRAGRGRSGPALEEGRFAGDGSVPNLRVAHDSSFEEPTVSTSRGGDTVEGGPRVSAAGSEERATSSGSGEHGVTGENRPEPTHSTAVDDSGSTAGTPKAGDASASPEATSEGARPAESAPTESQPANSQPVDARSGVTASSGPRVTDTGDGSSAYRAPGRGETSPIRTDSGSSPVTRSADPTRSAGVSPTAGRAEPASPVSARSTGAEATTRAGAAGDTTRERVSGAGDSRELVGAGARARGDDGGAHPGENDTRSGENDLNGGNESRKDNYPGTGPRHENSGPRPTEETTRQTNETPGGKDRAPASEDAAIVPVDQVGDRPGLPKDTQTRDHALTDNRPATDQAHPLDTSVQDDRPPIENALADHAERTPAGISLHGGDPTMGDLPHRVPADDRYFTVDGHVTPEGNIKIGGHEYTPEEFGNKLPQLGWDGEKPIRLIGCDASENGVAGRLAGHLGVDVLVATEKGWTDENGRVYSSSGVSDGNGNLRPRIPPDGKWETSHPDGTKSPAGEDGFAPGTSPEAKRGLVPDHAVSRSDSSPPEHDGQHTPGEGHHEPYDHNAEPTTRDAQRIADLNDRPGLEWEDGVITKVDGRPIDEHVDTMAHDRADKYRAAAEDNKPRPGERPGRHAQRVAQSLQDGTYVGQKTHGAVTAVVVDPRTGIAYEGVNGTGEDVIPASEVHPALRANVQAMQEHGGFPNLGRDGTPEPGGPVRAYPHFDDPYGHAEVKAANQALWDRDKFNAEQIAQGKPPVPTGAEALKEFVSQTYKPFEKGGPKPTPYCANCDHTMGGARNYSGRHEGFPPSEENLVDKYVPPEESTPAIGEVSKPGADGLAGEDGASKPGDQRTQQSDPQHEHSPNDHAPQDGPLHEEARPSADEALDNHAEQTPAGISLHQGDPVLGDLPQRVLPDDNHFTVDAHITPEGLVKVGDHLYTPEEFGDALRNHGWDGEKPIRVIGCDAAENGFADRLAAHIGVDVLAPTERAWTDEEGRVFSSSAERGDDGNWRPRIPPDGEWNTSHPDGTKTHAGDDGFAPGTPEAAKHGLDPAGAVERGHPGRVPEDTPQGRSDFTDLRKQLPVKRVEGHAAARRAGDLHDLPERSGVGAVGRQARAIRDAIAAGEELPGDVRNPAPVMRTPEVRAATMARLRSDGSAEPRDFVNFSGPDQEWQDAVTTSSLPDDINRVFEPIRAAAYDPELGYVPEGGRLRDNDSEPKILEELVRHQLAEHSGLPREVVDKVVGDYSRLVHEDAVADYREVKDAWKTVNQNLEHQNSQRRAAAKAAGEEFAPRFVSDLSVDQIHRWTGIEDPKRSWEVAEQIRFDSQVDGRNQQVPEVRPGPEFRSARTEQKIAMAIQELNNIARQRPTMPGEEVFRPFTADDVSGDLRMVIDLPSGRAGDYPPEVIVCPSCKDLMRIYQQIFPGMRLRAEDLKGRTVFPV